MPSVALPHSDLDRYRDGVPELRYYEDSIVGKENRSDVEYVVTTEELKEMSRRFDPQPFHLDEDSPLTKEYGGLITCSAHTFAICCHITSNSSNKIAAVAGLGFDEMRLLRPIHPGDRLHAVTICLEKRESRSKPDRGIVKAKLIMRNQSGEDVFSIISTALILKRNPTTTG